MVFKMRTLSLPLTEEDLLVIHGSPLKRFSWKELKLATNNFSKKNVVGRGGFGRVYRGRLVDGSLVAIKRCARIGVQDAEIQFQTEVEIGGSEASDHPNILRLCGYCKTRTERLLVYPFMMNTSVDSWLVNRPPSQPPLDWPTRKRIALGAAKGLAHFHSGSSFTVIHCDIKAANILLNDQFEAVLCDFGLAKLAVKKGNESSSSWVQRPIEAQHDGEEQLEDEEESSEDYCFSKSCWELTRTIMVRGEDGEERRNWSCWMFINDESGGGTEYVTTTVRGTIGHIAPEYLASSNCSVKNDVFGYGVMLLELLTGQRSFEIDRLPTNDHLTLHDWVKQLARNHRYNLLVDPDLYGGYIKKEMKQLIQLALSCTREDPEKRPVMSQVIMIIENLAKRGHPRAGPLLRDGDEGNSSFSLVQLKLATYNFSNKNFIGKSRFNHVYRGVLQEDGSVVMVKRLVNKSKRARMQFQAEVKLKGVISYRHPNLLQLRGYCISGNERLLVYPFMANRSLKWQLSPERSRSLNWHVRKQIALGVAKGIAYLHYDCNSNVTIGRHIKPSNIWLDDVFNPFLCNLRLGLNNSSHAVGLINTNDVYWYGITLVLLISGKPVTRRATCSHGRDKCNASPDLHSWFKKKLRQHPLDFLVDPCLVMDDEYNDIKGEIGQLIQLALLCTQPSPTDRPEILQVIQMIQGISQGDVEVCFAFDPANLLSSDEQPLCFDQDTKKSSKPMSRSKGITISGNVGEPKMEERWKVFLSEVALDALPTKSKLWRSGMSVDHLCPLCKEYEEDNLHLFFTCDFSKQVWQLAVGVRIDMLGFVSVKDAVDVILEPDKAGIHILPAQVEPSYFCHKGVAVMHSIWTHRNKVCFDNVCPNVMEVVSSSRTHFPQQLV